MFSLNRLGISPVVTIALLLVVSVISVISFQIWFDSYQSQLFSDLEVNSNENSLLNSAITIVGGELYLNADSNLEISQLKINDVECSEGPGSYSGLNEINISDCLESGVNSIIIITSNEVISRSIYVSPDDYDSLFSVSMSSCYNSSNVGTLGTQSPCQNMLIVNKSMLNFAIDNNLIGSGLDYYIPFGGNNYTFGDSTYNIFTGQVTNIDSLFYNENNFNSDIGYWDTSSVTSMVNVFRNANSFNQSIENWDTSSVTLMSGMFIGATSFNQPLDSWDTSSVTDIGSMFYGATSFNQPLNSWNTSSVNATGRMFRDANSFNQSLDNWDTSSVTTMWTMFLDALSFNQNISSWNVSSVTSCGSFNGGASALESSNIPAGLNPSCVS